MFSIVRFLTIISIVVILKSTVVNSLPQNAIEYEDTALAFVQPNQGSISTSTVVNQNAPPNIINTDALDTHVDDSKKTNTISNDVEDADFTLNTNTGPLDANENEHIAIANTGEIVAICQRDESSECQSEYAPHDLPKPKPLSMGWKEWIKKHMPKPKKQRNSDQPQPGPPPPNDGFCPPGFYYHLCGDGPESDIGRRDLDVAGWRIHRTLVEHLYYATPLLCQKALFEVCCEDFGFNPDMPELGWVGMDCLIIKGVDYPAPQIQPRISW